MISRAQGVVACWKRNRQAGLARGIEPCTGKFGAPVAEYDSARSRKPVDAGDDDGDVGLRTASLVAGLHVQRGLRGHTMLGIHSGH